MDEGKGERYAEIKRRVNRQTYTQTEIHRDYDTQPVETHRGKPIDK